MNKNKKGAIYVLLQGNHISWCAYCIDTCLFWLSFPVSISLDLVPSEQTTQQPVRHKNELTAKFMVIHDCIFWKWANSQNDLHMLSALSVNTAKI